MNFIDDKELALRFKNDAVPARERLFYVLFFTFAFYLASSSSINFLFGIEAGTDDYIHESIIIVINILGVIICWKTNTHGDSHEFIERFVSLSFPIIVRYVTYMIIILCVIFFLIYKFDPSLYEKNIFLNLTLGDSIVETVVVIYYILSYVRLNSSIHLASH